MDNLANILVGLMMTAAGLLGVGLAVMSVFRVLSGHDSVPDTLKVGGMSLAAGLAFGWAGLSMLKHYKEYRPPTEY